MLGRNVFIIQLLEETKRCDGLAVGSKAELAEFLDDSLHGG